MHPNPTTRRDRCASCEIPIVDRPVLRMDEVYCCLGCAQGGPCVCTYEADLADDGVDRLGIPFSTVRSSATHWEELEPVARGAEVPIAARR